jgi:hypothetical protein
MQKHQRLNIHVYQIYIWKAERGKAVFFPFLSPRFLPFPSPFSLSQFIAFEGFNHVEELHIDYGG